jgi:hypothetical protein
VEGTATCSTLPLEALPPFGSSLIGGGARKGGVQRGGRAGGGALAQSTFEVVFSGGLRLPGGVVASLQAA